MDEAQAFLGLARAEARVVEGPGCELDQLLVGIERDLWILMAELATDESNRHKLVDGQSRVTEAMVAALETHIDDLTGRFELPAEFVVPGQNRTAALLDVARTVIRRAERSSLVVAPATSQAIAYLNRLSDLVWTMARWQEGSTLTARTSDDNG